MTGHVEDTNKDGAEPLKDQFLSLFVVHQKYIYGYIAFLVPNHSDAADVMQETVSIMWHKFDRFKPGTNFVAWGKQIARHRIMKYRDKKRRLSSKFVFSDESLHAIEQRDSMINNELDERVSAVHDCLAKLKDRDRQIVKMRYEQDITAKAIAKKIGRSLDGLYHSMSRIHHSLRHCVKRTLALRNSD